MLVRFAHRVLRPLPRSQQHLFKATTLRTERVGAFSSAPPSKFMNTRIEWSSRKKKRRLFNFAVSIARVTYLSRRIRMPRNVPCLLNRMHRGVVMIKTSRVSRFRARPLETAKNKLAEAWEIFEFAILAAWTRTHVCVDDVKRRAYRSRLVRLSFSSRSFSTCRRRPGKCRFDTYAAAHRRALNI